MTAHTSYEAPKAYPLDDEEAATRLLERMRGKEAWRSAPPSAGSLAARILKPLLPAQLTMSVTALQRQWVEIVGGKIAAVTEPEKIAQGASGRTLTLRVAGPAAPFVQHQIPLLLERCNLAGAKLTAIIVKQGAIARTSQRNVKPLSAPLSADAEQALGTACAAIQDPKLREALLRLGRALAR